MAFKLWTFAEALQVLLTFPVAAIPLKPSSIDVLSKLITCYKTKKSRPYFLDVKQGLNHEDGRLKLA